MPNYQCYVRGHGGKEVQMQPPSDNAAIDVITVGQLGCTMSDQVADELIYKHYTFEKIKESIDKNKIIYWTNNQRNKWYNNHVLQYEKPNVDINQYASLNLNLALDGDNSIGGQCGLFYWNELNSSLDVITTLGHKKTLFLSDILKTLKYILNENDTIQLFWTACMSGDNWPGSGKKVSFNPSM
jgi:hypothetical protein